MKVKVIIHKAEEGGYWAEVPSLRGCVSQGETYDETITNIHEAIRGYLSVDVDEWKYDEANVEEIVELPL